MKKRIAQLVLILALSVMCGAAFAQSSIKMTWQSSWAACSGTSVACADHQTITDVTVAGSPVVLTSTLAGNALTFTTPIPSPNFYATRLYNLVITYKDINGTFHDTAAATCGSTNTAAPCTVTSIPITTPPSASNFTGTVQ